MTPFAESVVEAAALVRLEALGDTVMHGPAIAAGEPGAERSDPSFRDVTLEGRLRRALARLNPDLPSDALEDAHRKLTLARRWRDDHSFLEMGLSRRPANRPDGG